MKACRFLTYPLSCRWGICRECIVKEDCSQGQHCHSTLLSDDKADFKCHSKPQTVKWGCFFDNNVDFRGKVSLSNMMIGGSEPGVQRQLSGKSLQSSLLDGGSSLAKATSNDISVALQSGKKCLHHVRQYA